jgi:inner membrane protease ATP23
MTFIDISTSEEPLNKKDEKSKSTTNSTPQGSSQWGYDLYPERREKNVTTGITALLEGKGRENIDKVKCERTVYKCIKQSPIVKLMMGALKSSGCPVDIRRHISCEECAPTVSGGFDPILNQVVVCQNAVTKPGHVQAVLLHEMIHMFDYCRHDLDFKNLDHLACTEIRAANLAHCSFMSAWIQGDVSIFNIKESHQDCVKSKALSSILAARNVTTAEAIEAVQRVFPKCYNDLEPVGRRIRRNSDDMFKAYAEGYYYGYDL